MQIAERVDKLRAHVRGLRTVSKLALVPTMGALHQGHLSLVKKAREHADHVAVSIFVNPKQFGVNEDLSSYPRPRERDLELLQGEGVDLVWAPTVEEMYPHGFSTNISVSGISERLCGAARPGHFDGVATVVCKLFQQVQPHIALFGEKDWQQLAVIRRMARDLDLVHPHVSQILGVETVREADGLAMSSRNAYLTDQERAQAASLPAAMQAALAAIAKGTPVVQALNVLQQTLVSAGFSSVDYAELCDAESLEKIDQPGEQSVRLLVAARIGKARLIDNMPLLHL